MHKIHRSSYYIRYSIFIIRIEYHRSKLGLSSVRNYEGTFVIAKLPRFRLVLLSRPPRILLLLAASYIGRRRTTRLAANITNSSVVVVPPKMFPRKKFYRARAHCNPLSDARFSVWVTTQTQSTLSRVLWTNALIVMIFEQPSLP